MAMLAVAVVLLLTDKLVLRERAGHVAGSPEKSVAVLPFENLSGDQAETPSSPMACRTKS